MDNSSSIFFGVIGTIREVLQKTKGKPISQLINISISKAFYSLNLIRYRFQYPHVKFGSYVKIRGKFSIKGHGRVEIGNNCSFISTKSLSNQIIAQDSTAQITIGNNCGFNGATLSIEGSGQIEIGNNCSFASFGGSSNSIGIQESRAKISIGDYCFFSGASITAKNYIEVKRRCLISDAFIIDTDYHSVEINRWDPNLKLKNKPIYIGENVWIGSRSVILKGVSIGKNSVIGLGTIVRQSVSENVVVIGNPQQIVKELDTSILPYDFSHSSAGESPTTAL